ncbi:hypothetical protein EJB05_05785, partial [Eragrostis curvula]
MVFVKQLYPDLLPGLMKAASYGGIMLWVGTGFTTSRPATTSEDTKLNGRFVVMASDKIQIPTHSLLCVGAPVRAVSRYLPTVTLHIADNVAMLIKSHHPNLKNPLPPPVSEFRSREGKESSAGALQRKGKSQGEISPSLISLDGVMTEPKDDHLSHSIQEPALHVMYNPTEDISFLQNHFGVEVATKISDLFKSHIANTHSVLERENLKLLRRIGEIFKEIQRSQGETEHSSRRRKLDLQNTKEMKVAEKVGNRVDNSNTPDGMEADAALKDQVSNVAKVSQQNESITVHKDMALGDRKTENESTDVQNMDWNHITSESYTDLKEKINMITNDLIERDEEMEDLESLNKTLLIMERRTNNELSEARRELIEVLRKMKETQSIIGVKQVGQIDQEVFLNARRLKGRDDDLKDAAFFSSKWQEEISNSGWHPFKVTIVDGVAKEVIMEDDERIVALKEEWGTEVYNSVVQALIELNEYNPSLCMNCGTSARTGKLRLQKQSNI